LEKGAKILSEVTSNGNLSHSENLMPMIDYALKCAGVCLGDIDLFAAANGPGSFTGIRISVATIKGLAFGTDKNNCIGVSSMLALAYNFYGLPPSTPLTPPSEREANALILPVIDARRKQVYNAVFEISNGVNYIKTDRIITAENLETELNAEFTGRKIIFAGDGADMCYGEINFDGKVQVPDILKKPNASALCMAAYDEYKKRGAVHPRTLAPSYLIKTQAEREYYGEKSN
jgi:tRNA threonylcarbamoyladenosine biosynthesis protein TsaB